MGNRSAIHAPSAAIVCGALLIVVLLLASFVVGADMEGDGAAVDGKQVNDLGSVNDTVEINVSVLSGTHLYHVAYVASADNVSEDGISDWEQVPMDADKYAARDVWNIALDGEPVLFQDSAEINLSKFDSGVYYIFLWDCNTWEIGRGIRVPGKCEWRQPFRVEKTPPRLRGFDDPGEGKNRDELEAMLENATETNDFNITFYPAGSGTYGQTQEFENRVARYVDSVMTVTPFRECPGTVETTVVHSAGDTSPEERYRELFRGGADLVVEIAEEEKNACFGAADASSTQMQSIRIHSGSPQAFEDVVLPHELGHVFGLCDEYDKGIWQFQNDRYPGGCANPWPAEDGRVPGSESERITRDELAEYDEYCTTLLRELNETELDDEERQAYTRYTCGRDLDGDPETTAVGIMGGGGAASYEIPEGTDSPVCTGLHVEMPGFHNESYAQFKQALNERGYPCG